MALQKCGTFAAYRRHLSAQEVPCEPCKEAARKQKSDRDAKKRSDSGNSIVSALENASDAEVIDALEETKDSLYIVRAALRSGAPHNTIAALTKRRDELVDRIQMLEASRGEADEIDAIISDISGWSSRAAGA